MIRFHIDDSCSVGVSSAADAHKDTLVNVGIKHDYSNTPVTLPVSVKHTHTHTSSRFARLCTVADSDLLNCVMYFRCSRVYKKHDLAVCDIQLPISNEPNMLYNALSAHQYGEYCATLDNFSLKEAFVDGLSAMLMSKDREWVEFLDKLRAFCGPPRNSREALWHSEVFDPRSAILYGHYADDYWRYFGMLLKHATSRFDKYCENHLPIRRCPPAAESKQKQTEEPK